MSIFCAKCAANDGTPHSSHIPKQPNMIYFGRFETGKSKSFSDEWWKSYAKYNINSAYGKRLEGWELPQDDMCLECGSVQLIDLRVEWFFRLIAWFNRATVIAIGCNEPDCKSSHLVFKLKDKYVGGK